MIREKIKFNIDNVDGLGQGVFKDDPVTFIGKTLPGEEGTAVVYRKAKGVRFAVLQALTKRSPLRITPECPVFDVCTGCQYLHTDYKTETNLKKSYLEHLVQPLFSGEIRLFPAQKRFGYRNRVQLHYDLETGTLGYISKLSGGLVSAEECLLPAEAVAKKIRDLYSSGKWTSVIPEGSPVKGTIEVYQKDRGASPGISVNKPYAGGGFMQVNNEMNKVLTGIVNGAYTKCMSGRKEPLVLDIFGGDGNLTRQFKNARVLIADKDKRKIEKGNANIAADTCAQDLYRKGSIKNLYAYTNRRYKALPDLLVFDPPRKGVKLIGQWADTFNPEYMFYVSCNPQTLRRDALNIKERYVIKNISLVDLFPGTRHFETFAVFERRK